MEKKNVLIVCGTLRKNGYNLQLANVIKQLIGKQADVSYLDYSELPPMNQDLESPEPASVAAVRGAVRAADGIWFVTPQYNASFPGHIKNLIDWLSRPLPGQGRGSEQAGEDYGAPAGCWRTYGNHGDAQGVGFTASLRGCRRHERTRDRHRAIRRVLADRQAQALGR